MLNPKIKQGNLDAVVEPLEVCVKKCGGNRMKGGAFDKQSQE